MAIKTLIVLLVGLILASVHLAEAQQPKKVPRIGVLGAASSSVGSIKVDSFRQGLRELGYTEEKNIVIEYRFAEGKLDRLPEFAAELVNLKVDLKVVASSPAAIAAKQATTTIPIVMTVSRDPVETGLIKSLAHPGGNVTGMTVYSPENSGKNLELLKEAFPKVARVAVLGDPTSKGHSFEWKELKVAAGSLAVQLQSLEVRSPNPDFKGAFLAAAKGHSDALLTLSPTLLFFHRKEIVTLTAKNRLPAMFPAEILWMTAALCLMGQTWPTRLSLPRRTWTRS